ncbi:hypothetical protein EDD17DRAFT_1469239 [Pisolithus thermaeus]|nr:hypothetical protein EDD17DRAFT_1469239 [Pisolithus thermaeus]
MKCEDKHSPFTNVPDRAEVEVYVKGTWQPCCTTDNFRVDLNDTPTSAWNTSASHVFAASFRDAHPGCDQSLKAIFNAWVVHFNYLCQGYESPLAGIRSLHRHRERKLQLYNCRLRMAHRHLGSYPSAVDVVQQLGPTGMSTDESEHDVRHGECTYRITCKAWRSATITAILHMLDALHLQMRYQQQWTATAGAWPHLHMLSSQLSN